MVVELLEALGYDFGLFYGVNVVTAPNADPSRRLPLLLLFPRPPFPSVPVLRNRV